MQTTYVSELIWNRTRACCTPRYRYTRCRLCCCRSGPRDEAFNSTSVVVTTWRHVRQFFTNLNWSLLFILQFKTGVKSTLTSQIKELDAINTFGIKNWWIITWNNSGSTQMRQINDWDGLASLAMRMNFLTKSWARCNNENVFTRTVLNKEKKAV